ncbi:M23 family metallopeptidase [Microbacterium sp. 2RAF4]|uniref:M23 family metallopeptidase n=1 Tax=Microbacterium sp. 2RAF4 TaxID=3232999 RepID=UPI003F9B3E42
MSTHSVEAARAATPAPDADLASEASLDPDADLALDADLAPDAPSLRSSRARRRPAAAHTATAAADSPQDETALHSQVTQTQAQSQTKPTPATEPRATQAPRSWDPRLRPRHMAPRAVSTPQTRVRREKRTWAKSKALGATLAIGVLITGAALPALNPTSGPAAAASAPVSTLADGMSQSYTSKNEIRAEIAPRGNFSATTPEEIKETRSRAAAAAIAAGMPLGSALDIPLAGRIVMPMADGTYSFTDGFGASRPGRSHLGQDFAAPVGTPINAAMKGCVSRSTESYQGYGVTIQIESIVDGQAVSTVYSHMTYGSRAVEVGDCVDEGQYIGDVGSTGYVFGSCLHFEVHINTVAVDPLPWLKKNVS